MRTPAFLLLAGFLIASNAHAAAEGALPASPPASPAPAKPAVATEPKVEIPSALVASPPTTPTNAEPMTTTDKPIPVTVPVDLFNGKDLKGWSYFVSGQPADIAAAVQIKDGSVLAVSSKPNGYLVLDPMRENYQMHLEWRWTTDNPRSSTNSGTLIHISPGALQQNIWPVSFQFQMKVQRAGDIISMSTAACAEAAAGKTANRQKDASEKPAGEWNSADLVVRGDTIECTINGVTQNKVTKCVPQSGKIGFQLEGYAYELRNLKLTPLEPEKPAVK